MLSPGGMTVPKYCLTMSGYSRSAVSMSQNRIPCLAELLAVAVEDDLGLVLRGDAGEVLALGLGDAELLVGRLHLRGQLVPLVDLGAAGLQVVVDVLEVDVGHVDGEPRRHRLALERAQAAQAHVRHPPRLALPPRDLLDDALVDALLRGEGVLDLVAPAELVLAEIEVERRHATLLQGICTTAIVTIRRRNRPWPTDGVRRPIGARSGARRQTTSTRAAMRASTLTSSVASTRSSISMKMHSPGQASAAWMTLSTLRARDRRPASRRCPGR